MPTKLKAAIFGCGQIAGGYDGGPGPLATRTHAGAYHQSKDATLVAVTDLDPLKAAQFSKLWGEPRTYSDARSLIEKEKPDIVSLCTPDETHAELLELCLGYPFIRGVWCEKPLATDAVRAANIVDAFEREQKVLMVNYLRRWNSRIEDIARTISQGDIGRAQKVVAYYGKGIRHNGSHAVDLLLHWFGDVRGFDVLASRNDFSSTDPTVDARLKFDGFDAYLLGTDSREFSLFEVDVLGTSGRIRLIDSGRRVEYYSVHGDPLHSGYRILHRSDTAQKDPVSPFFVALDELVSAIRSGNSVRSNGRSGLAVLKVCSELAESALKQR